MKEMYVAFGIYFNEISIGILLVNIYCIENVQNKKTLGDEKFPLNRDSTKVR